MTDKFSIELDSKFIENLFGLADMPSPGEVKLEDLHNVVNKIKSKLNKTALSSAGMHSQSSLNSSSANTGDDSSRPKSVLVVDDLGIITYQLDILFKRMDFEVTISQEINDAIDKYKKQDFGYAVIDLFIPTEREGFILLDELKKLCLLCKLNTKIIVMTASSKLEYQEKCLNRGADFYIEKSPGWQKRVMDACMIV
ncbi:MAG: response regulator [Candidatus Gastranaerophilales bacterium]|nr:response regulator [Candidatus Gastranaerophilales bacterium]